MAAVNLAVDKIKSSFDESQRSSASVGLLRHAADESRVKIDIYSLRAPVGRLEKVRRLRRNRVSGSFIRVYWISLINSLTKPRLHV